jgi:hypothetical protein
MNTTPTGIALPYEERRRDHENKVAEYLENCMFRGCTDETVRGFKSVLKRMFERAGVADTTQPYGYRPALVWELLNPESGYLRIGALIESLLRDNIAPDSRRKFITIFRGFLEYVLAKPNIPGSDGETFAEKYGPITLTLTRYDLPIHTQDQPRKERHALSPGLCADFFEWMRTDYVPSHDMPHIAARNYTAIVLQTEIGARVSELLSIKSEGDGCDIDKVKNRVRLFGKAKPYSGSARVGCRSLPLRPKC